MLQLNRTQFERLIKENRRKAIDMIMDDVTYVNTHYRDVDGLIIFMPEEIVELREELESQTDPELLETYLKMLVSGAAIEGQFFRAIPLVR